MKEKCPKYLEIKARFDTAAVILSDLLHHQGAPSRYREGLKRKAQADKLAAAEGLELHQRVCPICRRNQLKIVP